MRRGIDNNRESKIRKIVGFQSAFFFVFFWWWWWWWGREREIEGVVKIVKSTNCDLGERIIAQVDTHK
jgi:hypothetical protein